MPSMKSPLPFSRASPRQRGFESLRPPPAFDLIPVGRITLKFIF